MDSFLSLLQFADGLFPAGAYAHSFGLEYYVQSGEVKDAAESKNFFAPIWKALQLPPMRWRYCVPGAREELEISQRALPWMKHSMR